MSDTPASKTSSVLRSSSKMAVATFCSRIFGLVREQIMAAQFGASGLTDAFLVAYRIPNLLRDLFAEGAFSSAFVPTFIEARSVDPVIARKLLWNLFLILLLVTGFISLAVIIWAPELVLLFAPKFQFDPEKFEQTVNLTRIMIPFLSLVSIAALFMGALNSLKLFFIPALAPAFFNMGMIVSMLVLPAVFINYGYHPIYSLALGVLIGGFIQAAIQFPLLIKHHYGPLFSKDILNNYSKKVMMKLGPGLIGFAATQINLLVNTILATGSIVGAVSWLNYAFRLFQLPVGILSVSIGNSNLVLFSQAWKSGDKPEALALLKSSYNLSYLVVIPPMLLLYFFSEPLVRLIFERGEFGAYSTEMSALALRCYALGLPFYGLYKILVPSFYTLDRQKIPVYTSLFSILINISFCLWLTPILGFNILALGTSLSMLTNSMLLLFFLKRYLQLRWTFFFNRFFLKLVCATACAAIVANYSQGLIEANSSLFWSILNLTGASVLVIITYFLVLIFLGERAFFFKFLAKIQKK